MEDSGIDSGDHNGDPTGRPSCSDSSSSAGSGRSLPRASKQLQRKLEARIEHAKRLQQEYANSTPGLIPIQRLPIPGAKDQHQPLVQWDTDDSEEDIVNFFPLSRKESKIHHQELTDTFSIEEMSISGDDEEDEEDLHLVPPQTGYRGLKCCPVSFCNII